MDFTIIIINRKNNFNSLEGIKGLSHLIYLKSLALDFSYKNN